MALAVGALAVGVARGAFSVAFVSQGAVPFWRVRGLGPGLARGERHVRDGRGHAVGPGRDGRLCGGGHVSPGRHRARRVGGEDDRVVVPHFLGVGVSGLSNPKWPPPYRGGTAGRKTADIVE